MGFRRFLLPRFIVFAGLMLMVSLSLGSGVLEHVPAFADGPASLSLLGANSNLPKGGMRYVAQEVAQRSFEDEFGRFNLFIIFFVTLGPLKVIPAFVEVTRHASLALRRQLAFRSAGISTIVILLVVMIGQNMLRVWQIQLPSLMIAGGILLALVALRIILTQYGGPKEPPPPDTPGPHLAITPLAFPTILPPFGIAIALTLMIVATELGFSPGMVIALLVLVMGLNFVSMLTARPILKFIRPVTLRILGFILGVMQFALGIQFILTGVEIQTMVIQILLRGQ